MLPAQKGGQKGGHETNGKRSEAPNPAGKYLLGQGLYFRIAPGGSKQWFVRISVDGKRRELGLGGYPRVTLTEARALAERIRVQNRAGKIEAPRKRTTNPTYAEIAQLVEAREAGEWSAKTLGSWRHYQDTYILPVFGGTRVDRIDRNDVLAVLLPIHRTKHPRPPRYAAPCGQYSMRPPCAVIGTITRQARPSPRRSRTARAR